MALTVLSAWLLLEIGRLVGIWSAYREIKRAGEVKAPVLMDLNDEEGRR